MRTGLSTVQQTLTPEAAKILNLAIAEACRRGHGQTTPLHVAATLLGAPASHLRQACIRSHPNSSHPLQCRALELCFSVALDRLPAAQGLSPGSEPPISNALMAALKRAQAHQRRGCPEQQQQPLLAVKVELEQLIVSILDDPSVSRVMREASFSSPAVKATIEQSINMSVSSNSMGFRLGGAQSYLGSLTTKSSNGHSIERDDASSRLLRNSLLNPRFSSSPITESNNTARQVVETLLKHKKRNPVVVGEGDASNVFSEFVQKMENGEVPEQLKGIKVVPFEAPISSSLCNKDAVSARLSELEQSIEGCFKNGGVVVNVGDLKWLVEVPKSTAASSTTTTSSAMQHVVIKLGSMVSRYRASGRLWLVGIASCETYLRCLVYHPSIEADWDLQPLPVVGKPTPGMFPRFTSNPMESLPPFKGVTPFTPGPKRAFEAQSLTQKIGCCSHCLTNYEQELSLMENEKKGTSLHSKSGDQGQPSLPLWLGKSGNGLNGAEILQSKEHDPSWNRKVEELQKNWNQKCQSLHPHFHAFRPFSTSELPQEPLLRCSQLKDMNGNTLTESVVDKSVQDPFRIEKRFPISLDSTWRPPQSRPISSLFAQSNGSLADTNSRSSTNGHVPPLFQPSLNFSLETQRQGLCNRSNPNNVTTDLALGRASMPIPISGESLVQVEKKLQEESLKEQLKESPGCVSSNIALPWAISQKVSSASTNASLHVSESADQHKRNDSSVCHHPVDPEDFKSICKFLEEKVEWQKEAVCSVANIAVQHKSGRRFGLGRRGDSWLLFMGQDRIGMRKMATGLAEALFRSKKRLFTFRLGLQDTASWNCGNTENEEACFTGRGKTTLDKIAETVRLNPSSVLLLEDIDQADQVTRNNLVRAMEKGRLADSFRREVDLGRVIFIMTTSGSKQSKYDKGKSEASFTEDRLATSCSWPMQMIVENARFELLISKCKKRVSVTDFNESPSKEDEQVSLCLGIGNKRKANWIGENLSVNELGNVKKVAKEPLISLDLNLSVEENDVAECSTASQGHTDACPGSLDSSDMTVEQNLKFSEEVLKDILNLVQEKVEFKPCDFDTMARRIVESISKKFHRVVGSDGLLEIDRNALEQMLGFTCFNVDGQERFDEWIDKVLGQGLIEVGSSCAISADTVVKLVVDKHSYCGERSPAICLPSSISISKRLKPCHKAGAI